MPRYLLAGSNDISVPEKAIFIDKTGKPHLFPTLTPKKRLATHYNTPVAPFTTHKDNGQSRAYEMWTAGGQYYDYTEPEKKIKTKGGNNDWVNHVKQYAINKGISYKEALKQAKATYKKTKEIKPYIPNQKRHFREYTQRTPIY